MSRLLDFLFSTSGVVVVFSVVAVFAAVRPRSSTARRALLLAAGAYFAASVYAVPVIVSKILTSGYHRFEASDTPSGRVALVVFGDGDELVNGWEDRISIPSEVGAARVLEAARVYEIAHPSWVISSGGNVRPDDPEEPSSRNMRDMLVRLGVPAERIVLESTSRNTHDEAVLIAPMLRSFGANAVILVTSAVHMRRSLGVFRAVGWTATPAIAPDSWFGNGWDDWLRPSVHGVYFSGQVVHELLGIPYYRVRGWWR